MPAPRKVIIEDGKIFTTCIKCNIVKPIEEFVKYKRCKLGHTTTCKECARKVQAEWKENNKDKHYASGRSYRDRNKEHLSNEKKKWYYDHRDEERVKRKIHREANKERTIVTMSLGAARRRSPQKGVDCTVTIDYLMGVLESQGKKCALSGVPLTFGGFCKIVASSCSLDRIEQSKGYVPGNVRFLCHSVNSFRGSMSDAEFQSFVNSIKWNWPDGIHL